MTTTQFQRLYKRVDLTHSMLGEYGMKQLDIFRRFARDWSDVLLASGVSDNALRKVKTCVANTHTSKSCRLPVIAIDTAVASYVLRDNFHDVNLVVEACAPLTLPLNVFYERVNYDEYQAIMQRCRGYTYGVWSEEEMNHPGILRVARPNGSWSEVSGREKDSWLRRSFDTTWYSKDWSSGKLVPCDVVNDKVAAWPEGRPFDASTIFYQMPRCYLEGIEGLYTHVINESRDYTLPDYKPGSRFFCVNVRTDERAKWLITLVERALRKDLNSDALEQAPLTVKHYN